MIDPEKDPTRIEDVKRNKPAASGSLDVNLEPVTNAWQTITFGSPAVGIGYLGAGLGLLGYKLGPSISKKLRRLLSPGKRVSDSLMFDTEEEYEEWMDKQRKLWGWTLGGLGALSGAAFSYNPDKAFGGLLKYAPMHKKTSLYNDSLPLGQCMDMVRETPGLTPAMKLEAMNLLNSFNAPPSATVTGGDLVGQAIATGQDALAGAAIGYLTAAALGLPNPKSTAILGAVANTLGVRSALVGSLLFGD